MTRAQRLHQTLSAALTPQYIHIENESNNHRVPADSETHFRVTIVSTCFESLTRVARHRLVHSSIGSEFNKGLHALALALFTPSEWESQRDQLQASPPCQHR